MKEFVGKVAVVTGGCMGIGRAIAEKCISLGVRGLVIGDLKEETLAEVLPEILALRVNNDQKIISVQMDASLLDDVQRLLDTTLEAFGTVNLGEGLIYQIQRLISQHKVALCTSLLQCWSWWRTWCHLSPQR